MFNAIFDKREARARKLLEQIVAKIRLAEEKKEGEEEKEGEEKKEEEKDEKRSGRAELG